MASCVNQFNFLFLQLLSQNSKTMKQLLTIFMILAVTVTYAQRQEAILEHKELKSFQEVAMEHRDDPVGIWLHWDDGNLVRSVGFTAPAEWIKAARFTTGDLEVFDGWELTRIQVAFNMEPTFANVVIFQGPGLNDLDKKVEQEFDPVGGEWNLVILDEPYILDASEELIIGVKMGDAGDGHFPAFADGVTDHPGKGDILRTPAGKWIAMKETYSDVGDWCIRGFIEGDYYVTFNLEMSYAEFNDTSFDPLNHDVYVSGTFATWYEEEEEKDWAMPGTDDQYKLKRVSGLEPEITFFEDFSGGTIPEGWGNIDNNGDGKSWEIAPYPSYKPYSGDYAVKSHSWEGTPLNPDNWLITPQIYTPFNDYELSFYVKAQDPEHVAENYSVLVSTTAPAIDQFETIHTETLNSAEWQNVTLSLEEYAGERIFIAFRHHDCTDQLSIVLDNIEITGTPPLMYQLEFQNLDIGPQEYLYFVVDNGPTWDNPEWTWDPVNKEPNRGLLVMGDLEVNDLWGDRVTHDLEIAVVDEAGDALENVNFKLDKLPLPPSYRVRFVINKADPPPPVIMDGTIVTLDGRELYQDPDKTLPFQIDFYDVEPGEYDFSVANEDYLTEFGTVEVVDGNKIVDVFLVEGQAPQHSLTFNVTDTEGNNVQNAKILLSGNEYQTDANGQVSIDLTERMYPYTVIKEGYYFFADEVIVDGNVTENVTLEIDENPGVFEFALIDGQYEFTAKAFGYQTVSDEIRVTSDSVLTVTLPLYRTVEFDIVDENENAIPNAVVVFAGIENEPGDYLFENIVAGTYDYSVTAEGYMGVHDMVLVTDDVGQPITNVKVTLQDAHEITFNVDMTDATFSAYEVVVPFDPDFHTVYVSGPGFPIPGSDANYMLELEAYTVTFEVMDTEGEPITDAIITFDGEAYDPGHYVFEDVIPGIYDYMVEKEGYITVQDVVSVTDDILVEVILGEERSTASYTAMNESGEGDRDNGMLNFKGTIPLAEGEYEYKYYIVIYGETWNYPDLPEEQYRPLNVDPDYTPFSVYDVWGEYEEIPDPVTEIYEIFEDGTLPEYWQNVDFSGDGYRWEFVHQEAGYSPKEGDYTAMSRSWDGDPLQPDNWLITRQVDVAGDDFELSFWVKTQDPDWPHEHYSVFISTGESIVPGVFEEIHSETLTAENVEWQQRTLPLSGYHGELIYIAFRHWDCTDWFQILIDEIEVTGTVGISEVAEITSKVYPNPTRNLLNIKSEEKINYIQVYDLTGRVIYNMNVDNSQAVINVSNFNHGVYFLRIHTQKGIEHHKFQVTR